MCHNLQCVDSGPNSPNISGFRHWLIMDLLWGTESSRSVILPDLLAMLKSLRKSKVNQSQVTICTKSDV